MQVQPAPSSSPPLSPAQIDGLHLSERPDPGSVIRLIDQVRMALHAVEGTREALTFVVKADAVRYLAEKARLSAEVQNQAAEVTLRAKRAAGAYLDEVIPHQGGRPGENTVTLTELGVSENDSRRWQAIAGIPATDFETYIADTQSIGRELTTAGALAIAREGGHYQSPAQPYEAAAGTMPPLLQVLAMRLGLVGHERSVLDAALMLYQTVLDAQDADGVLRVYYPDGRCDDVEIGG